MLVLTLHLVLVQQDQPVQQVQMGLTAQMGLTERRDQQVHKVQPEQTEQTE
jgi:hypothetical protein